MFLSLETLTSIIRTGLPIPVELIDLVNSVITFLSQMTLLRWLTFLLGSQTVILIVLLFWISFFLLTLVFVLQWEILIMLSLTIDFRINSKQDDLFHRVAYDYSRVDWDGLCVIIWEMFHGRISLNILLLLLLVNFVSGFRLEMMYIFLIVSIRSNVSHLHGFIEISFYS